MTLSSLALGLLLPACTHPDKGDTGDTASGHASDTSDTQDADCVDYTQLVERCLEEVTPVDGGGSYYAGIEASSSTLADDLHALIRDHQPVSYDNLWDVFPYTDARADGTVWDIYSDPGDGSQPPYTYHFGADQCGEYGGEGDCYNREHLWPRDWFDGLAPMRSDLHHVFPVDGYVNSMRGSYPFGVVTGNPWQGEGGSMRGDSALCDYSGRVFEPADAYKGDIARAMLYMAVRYRGEDSDFTQTDATDGAHLRPWFETVMLAWHLLDPVSQKEIDRNDAVQASQGNRNPFIDHPEFACAIGDL